MKRVAVVALLLLALAGCAVPGQSLSPGTAYAYDGAEVSNAHIDAIYNSWQQLTRNQILPNRLQVLTLDAVREPAIALAIEEVLRPQGVGVVIEAEHSCMTLRGVNAPGASLTTSHLSGVIRDDPRTREEFLRLTRGG